MTLERIEKLLLKAVRAWREAGKVAVCSECGASIHPTAEAAHIFALDERRAELQGDVPTLIKGRRAIR
jgi:hypothetical protein